MFAKSILIVTVIGIVIGVIGYINRWDSPITYSNAFFLAGCLLIIAGASSRYAAGQYIQKYQMLDAESFREMSVGERVNSIIDEKGLVGKVILGVLSGLLLIGVSAIAAYLF